MTEDEWNGLTRQLVVQYLAIIEHCPLRGDQDVQRDGLAIVAWDLGEFLRGICGLIIARNYSAAYGFTRPILERAHTLGAIHHDLSFARRFWDASASFETLEKRKRLPKDALGTFRRFVATRLGDEPSMAVLQNQIALISSASLAVHPSALIPAFARRALTEESDANTIAATITTACTMALFVLVLIAEQRFPEYDYGPPRLLIRQVTDMAQRQ